MSVLFRPSAGAVVLNCAELDKMLVLNQVRKNGDRQVVAPKGGIEEHENSLEAAIREVSEEAGVAGLTLLGYLGQQRFGFLLDDGRPAEKTVDWFLMQAGDATVTPRAEEGFGEGQWYTYSDARNQLSHDVFIPFVERAELLASWRLAHGVKASRTMHRAVIEFCQEASTHCNEDGATLVLCGSAARGDYVSGWSDLDFVVFTGGGGGEDLARKLNGIARLVEDRYGIHIAARVGDSRLREVTGLGPLYDMKLRAVARRVGVDSVVISGHWTGIPDWLPPEDLLDDLKIISVAARTLLDESGKTRTTSDGYRRTLSVMCSAARLVACEMDPLASLLLIDVAQLVGDRWKGLQITRLLRDFDSLRTSGTIDSDDLCVLASAVPTAIDQLINCIM